MARAAGIDVTANIYPYPTWESPLTALLPERDFTETPRALAAARLAVDQLGPAGGLPLSRYAPNPAYVRCSRTAARPAGMRGGSSAAPRGHNGRRRCQHNCILHFEYPARSAPITLANGTEARLIEAEADLRGGGAGTATAFTTLNTLRATTTPALAALTPAATPAGQIDQLFKERAYWLWLTAHRTGDLRRLVRQYTRPAESVFPSGAFFRGGNYGTDVNWPLPTQEANNPNYRECTDRNA